MSKVFNLLVLAGDGVGPEVMNEALKLLSLVESNSNLRFNLNHGLIGGCSIDSNDEPITNEVLESACSADAVLLGAVGGPKWDNIAKGKRPEVGLLRLRKSMGVFANYRPAVLYPQLASASTLKEEVISGLDLLILRELISGIYFGEPRGEQVGADNKRFAFNTMRYSEDEIRAIGSLAFEAARGRNKRLCSIDKANVLEVSQLWRKVMNELSIDYPDVELEHMYVDNAVMQLVKKPKEFDVIVTSNLFGDIISDCAAMLTGSIGMLPSSSMNSRGVGLYEPVHGSAPDIAGLSEANPIAMILSLAMMIEYSCKRPDISSVIRRSVSVVLDMGCRTRDICKEESHNLVSTGEMGDLIGNTFQDEVLKK